jgi:hypothetical protein
MCGYVLEVGETFDPRVVCYIFLFLLRPSIHDGDQMDRRNHAEGTRSDDGVDCCELRALVVATTVGDTRTGMTPSARVSSSPAFSLIHILFSFQLSSFLPSPSSPLPSPFHPSSLLPPPFFSFPFLSRVTQTLTFLRPNTAPPWLAPNPSSPQSQRTSSANQ